MAKSLFLMILIGIAAFLDPGLNLTASDTAVVSDLNTESTVESVAKVDNPGVDSIAEATKVSDSEAKAQVAEAKEQTATQAVAKTTAKNVANTSAAKSAQQPAQPAAPANSITIAGNTIEIVNVSAIVDSGYHVNRYSKLLYGHNYSSVFGKLSSLGVGSTFVVRVNGHETTYRVGNKVYYDKDNSTKNGALRRNGGKKNYMRSIANAYDFDASKQYDFALMTCAGKSLGGGDATQRLVLYASAI